jgi:hypothetical protein
MPEALIQANVSEYFIWVANCIAAIKGLLLFILSLPKDMFLLPVFYSTYPGFLYLRKLLTNLFLNQNLKFQTHGKTRSVKSTAALSWLYQPGKAR